MRQAHLQHSKKQLGTHFYRQKKYPYPVDLGLSTDANSEKVEKKIMAEVLEGLISNKTYFVQGNGPEYAVKIGRTKDFSGEGFFKNAKKALKGILACLIERGLKLSNLRRVAVKSDKTESFPIFSHLNAAEKKSMKRVLAKKKEKK